MNTLTKRLSSLGSLFEFSVFGNNLIIICLLLCVFFSTGYTNEYNSSYWKEIANDFKKRTYVDENYIYDQLPVVNTCSEGLLSQGAKDRVLKAVNETRALHDLPPVLYSFLHDEDAQKSALIINATGTLTHHPSENAECYSQEGYDGSSTGNLFSGHQLTDAVYHILGWINDANNVSTVSAVGHRRWIITPFLEYVSYGQVYGPSCLKVFDFNRESPYDQTTNVDFVAFPYNKYPYLFFNEGFGGMGAPWSFTMIEDKNSSANNQYDYFSSANVVVREKNNRRRLKISNIKYTQPKSKTVRTTLTTQNIYFDSQGFGVPNIITWKVADWEFDTWYEVEINNIQTKSGETHFTYDVFVDYKDLIDINEELESGDILSGHSIIGTLSHRDDKDSYNVNLGGDTTLTGSSQYSNMAFFISLYNTDTKELIKSQDSPFSMDLPEGEYTIIASLCNESNTCYDSSNFSYQIDIQTNTTTTETLYTLSKTISPVNGGTITISPDKTSYTMAETVTLTALPDSGYEFANWSGDASGSDASIMITMDEDKSVIANFTKEALVITATASPTSGTAPLIISFYCEITSGVPPYTFSWDFGDGSAEETSQNPSHTYDLPGTYAAMVSVTDASDQNRSEQISIVVQEGVEEETEEQTFPEHPTENAPVTPTEVSEAAMFISGVSNGSNGLEVLDTFEVKANIPEYDKNIDVYFLMSAPDGRVYCIDADGKLVDTEGLSKYGTAVTPYVTNFETALNTTIIEETSIGSTDFPAGQWLMIWAIVPTTYGDKSIMWDAGYSWGYYFFTAVEK